MIHSTTPRVTVPNGLEYAEILTDFVRNICCINQIRRQEENHLCVAVEEAFLNAVQHGFADDQDSSITLSLSVQAGKATASLCYNGYPLDPELLPKSPKRGEHGEPLGLGLLLMQKMMDRVEFINHGPKGQETRLTLYVGTRLEDAGHAEGSGESVTATTAGKVPYTIRQLRPEEAVEVARLAYLSYGDSYPYEDIYYPDRIRELNRLGKLMSFVAVTDEGEVISHAAMTWSEEDRHGMAELGLAFTKPSRRGLGCMNKLWASLLDEARRMHLFGAFILAVTSHPFTQKCSHGFGFVDTAFLAAEVPGLRFNKLAESNERESILFECQVFDPPQELVVYAPKQHEVMIRTICDRLGLHPRFEQQTTSSGLPDSGRMRIVTKPAFGTVKFSVIHFGDDLFGKIQTTSISLLMHGNAPLFLHIPLDSPFAPALVDKLEAAGGWFFAGIVPSREVGLELVMQHIGKYRLDYTKLAAASDAVSQLLAYVQHRDEAVQLQ